MIIKKLSHIWFFSFFFLIATTHALADAFGPPIRHVLEIKTKLSDIVGQPTWLIIIRDMDTGRLNTFIYDFRLPDNQWIAYSKGRKFRIINSSLKFGPGVTIYNFCNIEDGILDQTSMYITLTGAITPDPYTTRCKVLKYNDIGFTIVQPN